MKNFLKLTLISLLFIITGLAPARNRVVNLSVAYKYVNYTGVWVKAIAVNNRIPGPILHFKDGDHVTINVHNHLNKGTSIHWHGLIVPWKMDGVPGVTQKYIAPGGVFHYRFTLHQYGTYWYHAHAGLQEQSGLYGAIIIDPPERHFNYNKDYPIVLSDWSDTKPDEIYLNLKRTGHYYETDFPLQTSLYDYLKGYANSTPKQQKQLVHDYWKMEFTRMGLYDISDIAYNAFLLNGRDNKKPWIRRVHVGDIVRLRFIDAGADTLFKIKIPGTRMQIIHVQGVDVKPAWTSHLLMGPGETYDVLVKIKHRAPYYIYAEALNTSGAAIGVLATNPNQHFNFSQIKPFPKPKPITMRMPLKTAKQTHTKYDKLRSASVTNDPHQKAHVIKIMLSGYMNRYIWFINGKKLENAPPIMIKKGQRYRFIFMNHTIMHHPMHVHGHWFILQNGHGAYDPLLHTIDVPPNSTIIADLVADQSGQWFFHCHNLYHMTAGMARIIRYDSLKSNPFKVKPQSPMWYTSRLINFGADFANDYFQGDFKYFIGTDFNKFQINSEDFEIDNGQIEQGNIDFFYWRLLGQFWALKGGANYVIRPSNHPYWQPGVGIEGELPLFIDLDLRSYVHHGSVKFDLFLERENHIYRRFFIDTSIRTIFATKTVSQDQIGSGFNRIEVEVAPLVQLNPAVAIYFEYRYERYYNAAKTILQQDGEATTSNNYLIGTRFLF